MSDTDSSFAQSLKSSIAICQKISKFLDIIVTIPVTILLIALVIIVGYSVIARYLFNSPPPWTEEVSLFMIVATIFFCLRVTFKNNQQIGVTIFIDRFRSLSLVFTLFSYLMSMLFLGILTKQSFQGASLFAVYKAPSTGLSFYWLYMAMAIGFGLSFFEILLMTVQRICKALLNKIDQKA